MFNFSIFFFFIQGNLMAEDLGRKEIKSNYYYIKTV